MPSLRENYFYLPQVSAAFLCFGKILSSAGQTYFGVASFIYYVLTYGKEINCNASNPDPGCPDQLSAEFLYPCLFAIVCNVSVVAITRLLNLYGKTTELNCWAPRDQEDDIENDAMSTPTEKRGDYYWKDLTPGGKWFAGISIVLGCFSTLSVALNGYFSAVKLLRYLVFLSTKDARDAAHYNDPWLQGIASLVLACSFLSYVAYNVNKVANNAVELASKLRLSTVRSRNADESCCNWMIGATVALTILNVFLGSFAAFFSTSHALQDLGHTLGIGGVDDISADSSDPLPAPSSNIDIGTIFTLPSALNYVLLTSVFSIYKLLQKIQPYCCGQPQRAIPTVSHYRESLLSPDRPDSAPHPAESSRCIKTGKTWFWIAGVFDSLFAACGGFISVISLIASINKGHIKFMKMHVSEEAKLFLAILNGISTGIGNFAFSICEGYADFLTDCEKRNAKKNRFALRARTCREIPLVPRDLYDPDIEAGLEPRVMMPAPSAPPLAQTSIQLGYQPPVISSSPPRVPPLFQFMPAPSPAPTLPASTLTTETRLQMLAATS